MDNSNPNPNDQPVQAPVADQGGVQTPPTNQEPTPAQPEPAGDQTPAAPMGGGEEPASEGQPQPGGMPQQQ